MNRLHDKVKGTMYNISTLKAWNTAIEYDDNTIRGIWRALPYYRLAANRGHIESMNELAIILRDIYRNRKEALCWFKRAADGGNTNAQVYVGYSLYYGEGVRIDRKRAISYYRKAALRGNVGAMCNLGLCYKEGGGVSRNYRMAKRYFMMAAQKGHSRAMFWLGHMYFHGEGKKDYRVAGRYFMDAIGKGDRESHEYLGVLLHDGKGMKRDLGKAAEHYRIAARYGYGYSQYCLGMCYLNGEGVRRSKRLALLWLRKAAVNGEERLAWPWLRRFGRQKPDNRRHPPRK